ncbi:hypothetical protein GBAR_LOCUS22630, partial [Geodia barretti]
TSSLIDSVCILPVWETGQLTLHCQYPIEEATLVWWIEDGVPVNVNSDVLPVNESAVHRGIYQCMLQL